MGEGGDSKDLDKKAVAADPEKQEFLQWVDKPELMKRSEKRLPLPITIS